MYVHCTEEYLCWQITYILLLYAIRTVLYEIWIKNLRDNTIISYKVDNHYNPNKEITIDFNDRELNIIWPKIKSKKYLSKKDKNGISLKEFIKNYNG